MAAVNKGPAARGIKLQAQLFKIVKLLNAMNETD